MSLVKVQEGAESAEELGVHPPSPGLPVKELVVQVVILVQPLQVLCKVSGAFELVNM